MMKFCNMNLSKALFIVALVTLNVLLVPILSIPVDPVDHIERKDTFVETLAVIKLPVDRRDPVYTRPTVGPDHIDRRDPFYIRPTSVDRRGPIPIITPHIKRRGPDCDITLVPSVMAVPTHIERRKNEDPEWPTATLEPKVGMLIC